MGFLIFVIEQSVHIHQYCWKEGVTIRLLTKFKGDTPKGCQTYCTTRAKNFIWWGARTPPPPPPLPHHTDICKITRLFSWVIFLLIFNKSHLNLAILWHSFQAVLMKVYVKVYLYWNIATYSVKSGTWLKFLQSSLQQKRCETCSILRGVQEIFNATYFTTRLRGKVQEELSCVTKPLI